MTRYSKYTLPVIIVLGLVLLGSNNLFAGQLGSELKLQPQTEPTLQETMDWLASKLEGHCQAYMNRSLCFRSLSVDRCVLRYAVYGFPDATPELRTDFSAYGKREFELSTFKDGRSYIDLMNGDDTISELVFESGDNELSLRILKALNHAHKLCTEKSSSGKEPF